MGCPDALDELTKGLERQMWQVNGLMLVNVIIMGVVVFIGVFAPRYRRHLIVGFIFQGANTLFLPIISTVAATAVMRDNLYGTTYFISGVKATVEGFGEFVHNYSVMLWTGLVIFVGIHTFAVVAGDPREGRNIAPSTEMLLKAIWVAYLMGIALLRSGTTDSNNLIQILLEGSFNSKVAIMFTIVVAITISKIYQKYRVFYVARGSFILGLNPRLIVSYMAQLDRSHDIEQVERHVVPPPSLIVMEGGPITLEEQTGGYNFEDKAEHQQSGCMISLMKYFSKNRSSRKVIKTKKDSELVTLDKVWGSYDIHFSKSSTLEAKDLCFSFALFKLLRCRFAKSTVSEAGFNKARRFFWHTYLQQGADYERVFRVIADELSFFHDYYYSPISTPFLHRQFLLARVFNQVLTIGGSLCILVLFQPTLGHFGPIGQFIYTLKCGRNTIHVSFGSMYVDVVAVWLVLAAILVSEIRETMTYLCSNFNKVVLICNYVSNTRCQKFVLFVFKYLRCEWLLNNWDDTMSQCKLLVFHPWEVSILFRRLVRLPNQKKIKVPSEVKKAIFKALQGLDSEHEGQALKHIRFPLSPVPNTATVDAGSACDGKGAADTILAWHIATCIFEVRQPQPADHPLGCKTAAVRLSQYCAYLVGYRPELLPDDVEWCKTLHQTVKKEAAQVLATPPPGEDEFKHLVNSLSAESNHEVLRNGARLAQKLVHSGKGWEELAKFWSEMILYIAPSEKLDEHAEAISRGGELVTLVWALLAHAGIVERLDDTNATAATSDLC